MKFNPSKPFTVGIELEVQIVDPETLELKPASSVIFSNSPTPLIQKEFLQSMVEFVSGVHKEPEEAVSELKEAVERVCRLGEEKGFLLSASGTHPTANPEKIKVTPDERYLKLLNEFQEVLRNFLIYGLHIHVGLPDEKMMMNTYNAFVKFSPLLLALSASSPFFRGKNTGILSYRTKLFEQLPRAGVPQHFETYEEFLELYGRLKETGTVESLKDIWWDVRPRPDFGTVELRVCDAVADFKRLEGLVSLSVMIGELFSEEGVEPEYHQVNLQNKWNAARHGLSGAFITETGRSTVGRELHRLVNLYGKRFGKRKEAAKLLLNLITEPTQAEQQLDAVKKTGDTSAAVKVSLLNRRLC